MIDEKEKTHSERSTNKNCGTKLDEFTLTKKKKKKETNPMDAAKKLV